jgi:hypothetical protein
VEVGFRPDGQGQPQLTARVHLSPGEDDECHLRQEVECERGQAVIAAPTEIIWENGTGPGKESLLTERSEAEVTLDQFCRRIVGGLIPVANVDDVSRSLAVAQAAWKSLQTGEAVSGPWG